MRATSRLLVMLILCITAAGPAIAAPATLSTGATVARPDGASFAVTDLLKTLLYGGVVFGAIRIKDTGSLATKFATRAAAAATDYKDGVAQAGSDWQTNAANSADAYAQGVQEAIGDGRFAKGIADAGAGKYVKRATELGAQRYAPGVNAGKDEWAKNVAPFLDRLKGLTLPPRGPRRSPQNMARANMVAAELGKLATGK
jgi:hypothetical protein